MNKFTSKLRLIYFDMPGRAEGIRLALHYGKIPFEDVRLSRADFAQKSLQGSFAFDQLPALEIPDKQVTLYQSAAILRYVGIHSGLYPQNDLELAALIDALVDQHNDMLIGINASRFPHRVGFNTVTKEQILASRKELTEKILPKHFRYFDSFLKRSKTGWLASTPNPTTADFALVPRLSIFAVPNLYEGISHQMLDEFPRLQSYMSRFYQIPEVKDYYEKNPFDPSKQ